MVYQLLFSLQDKISKRSNSWKKVLFWLRERILCMVMREVMKLGLRAAGHITFTVRNRDMNEGVQHALTFSFGSELHSMVMFC